MEEIFKDIEGYEGKYQISNLGNVKAFYKYENKKYKPHSKILKQKIKKNGYVEIGLSKDNKTKYFTIHRLVAKTFIPNQENKPEVNHIDGNKQNNCVTNLEWVTSRENQKHAFKLGLQKPNGKENYKYIKPFVEKSKIKVCQYDLNNNYIQTFGSIEDAKRYLKEIYNITGHVWECTVGKRNSTGGFKWLKESEVM